MRQRGIPDTATGGMPAFQLGCFFPFAPVVRISHRAVPPAVAARSIRRGIRAVTMKLQTSNPMSSALRRVVAGVLVSLACAAPYMVLAQSGATLEVTPSGRAPAGSTVAVK
jgi:hypothetical protein